MKTRIYGVLGGFDSPDKLMAAVRKIRGSYDGIDALTPYPVEGLVEELGHKPTRLPWLMLAGGVLGGAAIYGLQLYSVLIAYPLNVGGRPLNSWPAFLVPAVECAILGAGLFGFFGMLIMNRLPKLYHPVFNARHFSLARGDVFYLLIEGHDPSFDATRLKRQLKRLGAVTIDEVAP